ncbi:hypothetical protein ACGFX4_24375 [Kitasatospora sp. NPDC048365]|uniref:hypothetical protein n=1 Tax=Kitasatospora sp. NPDC048365 TaxID=3364050 RepID=UPI003723142B
MTKWTKSPAPAVVFGLVAAPAVAWVVAGMIAHQLRACYGHLDASSAMTANGAFVVVSVLAFVVGAVALMITLTLRRVEQAPHPARVMIAVMGGAVLFSAFVALTLLSGPSGDECPPHGYGASAVLLTR